MNCPKCGAIVDASSQSCANCGSSLMSPDRAMPPASGDTSNSTSDVYAGFWRRSAAYLIDCGILYIALLAGGFAAGSLGLGELWLEAVMAIGSFFGFWLYRAIMESSARQATVGKLALGIKVTDYAGRRIGFGRATGRYFGMILSSLILSIGYVMAGFTKRRQALHDMVAKTLVVKKAATQEFVASGPVGRPVPTWAKVLLVLTGALPLVVGIGAAIAIPAYQDSLIRAQVSEGLMEAVAHEAAVATALDDAETWDELDSDVLDLSTDGLSRYVQSIEVANGNVVITFGREASRPINTSQLVLVPGIDEQDNLVWICGRAPLPDGVEPAIQEHEQYTNVPAKYLPASCRGVD